MGVDGGHKLTFRLLNLNFEHLLTIAWKRHADSGNGGIRQPSIYLDASWISQKFKARKGGPINTILDIVTGFAREGFCATIVCNGAHVMTRSAPVLTRNDSYYGPCQESRYYQQESSADCCCWYNV
jgi:hypothetical protein